MKATAHGPYFLDTPSASFVAEGRRSGTFSVAGAIGAEGYTTIPSGIAFRLSSLARLTSA
jgi:hypothetical protein